MDLSKVKTIYMIGIKGVGMTMLAEFLAHEGYIISGSDTTEVFMTDAVLAHAGITVHQGFSAEHISDADLVIYSTAYNEDNNEELKAALTKKMRVATFAESLGAVFNTHHGIAVAGSHGKTTVTAWLGFVMKEIGMEPNVMVGAQVPQFNGAGLYGSSNYLVIEADEYQNKLQYFNPKMILLNNIDYDHPDFFKDKESYEKVFADFIAKLPKAGILVAHFDDKKIIKIAEACRGRVASYGFSKNCDYQISETSWDGQQQYFKLKLQGDDLGNFAIQLNGQHNILNATAVIVAAIELGADLNLIRRAIEKFSGTARRLQVLGNFRQALIVDDYAHHPTEIKASLEAAKQKWPKKKIRVVFHPHTFSRTAALLDDFATSFKKANEIIVLDIYQSARETSGAITSEQVAKLIKDNVGDKKEVKHIATLEEAEKYLRETAADNDLILLMGAGDVFRIGERLLHND